MLSSRSFLSLQTLRTCSRRLVHLQPTNLYALQVHLPKEQRHDLASLSEENGFHVSARYQSLRAPDANLLKYSNKELQNLRALFADSIAPMFQCSTNPEFAQFMQKQFRRWSIESATIEGLVGFDPYTKHTLITAGFSSVVPFSHSVAAGLTPVSAMKLLADQEDLIAAAWKMTRTPSRHVQAASAEEQAVAVPLSIDTMKTMHAALVRAQTHLDSVVVPGQLWQGTLKPVHNYVAVGDGSYREFCVPELVESELRDMCARYNKMLEDGVAAEVTAAWLHHRFAAIHPFSDGNGRLARLLASVALFKGGQMPLMARALDKTVYLRCLELADAGHDQPFVDYVAHTQRSLYITYLQEAREGASQYKVLRPLERAVTKAINNTLKAFTEEFNGYLAHAGLDHPVFKADTGVDHSIYLYEQLSLLDVPRVRLLDTCSVSYEQHGRDSLLTFVVCYGGFGVRTLFATWIATPESGLRDLPLLTADYVQFNLRDSPETVMQRVEHYVDAVLTQMRAVLLYQVLHEDVASVLSEKVGEKLAVFLETPVKLLQ